MRPSEIVVAIAHLVSRLFWRLTGLVLFMCGLLLTLRELYLIGQPDEVSLTTIAVRIGMHPVMGVLQPISIACFGFLCMYMPIGGRRLRL